MIDSNSWEPIRILIVDDHPVVRHGLRNLLSIHPDFEIVGEAEDGAQVFPLLAANKTDVILLDIQMSGQGGIDANHCDHVTIDGVDGITEIEEALIAKAANIGLMRMPKKGNRTPAATGTPEAL